MTRNSIRCFCWVACAGALAGLLLFGYPTGRVVVGGDAPSAAAAVTILPIITYGSGEAGIDFALANNTDSPIPISVSERGGLEGLYYDLSLNGKQITPSLVVATSFRPIDQELGPGKTVIGGIDPRSQYSRLVRGRYLVTIEYTLEKSNKVERSVIRRDVAWLDVTEGWDYTRE